MASLAKAVILTRKYASFFKAVLNDEELHRWLIIDKPISSRLLKKRFPQKHHHSKLRDNDKLKLARKAAGFLSIIPTVNLVAATGSLAIGNVKPKDDIDLMVITSKDTLWPTRLFVIPLISLFFKRRLPAQRENRDSICLNLWLDETALSVPIKKRNLYTAHEVLQALPLFDRGNTYAKFIRRNSWTKKHLANAYASASLSFRAKPRQRRAQSRNPFLYLANLLAFRLQYLYMKKKITNETVSLHSAYFHPRTLAKELDKFLKP